MPAALTALLATVALVAAGCGGEDDAAKTARAEEGLSQEQYVAEVREAIRPIATESQKLITQATEASRIQDLAQPLGDAQQAYQDATDQLESLEPPSEVEDLHGRLVQAQQVIADAAEAAERGAQRGDRQGLEEFRRAGDRYRDRVKQLSRQYSERGFEF